jgi:hypothetical protein
MKLDFKHGFGLVGICLVLGLASACGESKDGSLLDPGAGGEGSGATGTGGKQPVLGSGGDNLPSLGGEGSGLGQGGDGSCGSTRLEAALPNVLLVVDKSLSMNQTPTGFDANKWDALHAALAATFDAASANLSLGLDLYPRVAAANCEMPTSEDIVVSIQAGTDAAPLILAELEDTAPSGGTPTAAALTRALDYYTTGAGMDLRGERYVLLATDGGPNCNADLTCEAATCTLNIENKCPANMNCCDAALDPEGPTKCLDEDASIDAVAALTAAGIKTFVVGIPGTEDYAATLDLLAAESGVTNPDAPPDYFAVSADGGDGGLSAVLGAIATEIISSCRLPLEENPPDLSQIFVVVDGQLVQRDDADGWQLDRDTSPPTVELTGAACDQVEAGGVEYINISYGCPDFEPH